VIDVLLQLALWPLVGLVFSRLTLRQIVGLVAVATLCAAAWLLFAGELVAGLVVAALACAGVGAMMHAPLDLDK
jgi:hypothetical protein